jgi:hypothetical protein
MLDTDFEPTIDEENFIDEATLGDLEKCLFPPDFQKNIHSNEYGSISFGQFFGVSNQEHSMGSPLALIKPKTSTCQDESRFSSSSPVIQAPCLEIHCYIGGSLVSFLDHYDRIWLPHDELPPCFPK